MKGISTYVLYSLHEGLQHNRAGNNILDDGHGLSRGLQGHIHLGMDCDIPHLHMLVPVDNPSHSCSFLLLYL